VDNFEVLSGADENHKNLIQDNLALGWDLNPWPPEHETGVLATRPRLSVSLYDGLQTEQLNKSSMQTRQDTVTLATIKTTRNSSMVEGACWEADSHLAGQEISRQL
jgi:hypothetical protein